MHSEQFLLPLWIDFSATFFVGISGALVGVRRGYDVVGIFFLALVTAIGGAFLRDGIFIQNGPPAVVNHELYLLLVAAASAIGVLFRNNLHRMGRIVSIMDAVGLAAYAVWGATKALSAGISAPGAILVGAVNAVGGGLLRDICTKEEPMIFRPGEFYALVAIFGATAYVLLLKHGGMHAPSAAYLCIGLMLLVRWLTIVLHWKTKSFATLYGDGAAAPKAPAKETAGKESNAPDAG